MELAELSENSVNSPFTNNIRNAADPYMVPDWYCTSSSSCSNEATSCSTFGSLTEFDSGASSDNVWPGSIDYGCKEKLFKELEALHDPVITELVKSSMVVCQDPEADTLDSMLYSNGSDELVTGSALGGAMQGSS